MKPQKIQNIVDKTIYHHIKGVVCLIGYGACGKGFVPIMQRHFTYDRFVIIDPIQIPKQGICDKFYHLALKKENYIQVFDQIFQKEKGFCVNLSVGTSSKDITQYCQSKGIFYIDTVKEQWEGFYQSEKISASIKSNYGLRYTLNQQLLSKNYKTTAISCCGANPGMVSWFLKKALVNIAEETGFKLVQQPKTRSQWAKLMKDLGIKGVHIAERDTQQTNQKRPLGHFWNTWSVDGFISEGFYQPSQLGWGTHQKWFPSQGRQHQFGDKCAIYLNQPGMATQVRSWCPTPGAQLGYLVTHDESISISDYYSVKQNGQVIFRPTVMYAYHPCDDAVLSCFDILGACVPPTQDKWKILNQEIVSGSDELGVLVYGHSKNAYWYGSQLNIGRARNLIQGQSATVLQVTSSVLAGIVWAIENPESGLVDTNQMDYKRCLQIQDQYIQQIKGVYTDWNPLKCQIGQYHKQILDGSDPWQFRNILIQR